MGSSFTPSVLTVRPAPNVQTFLSGSGTYTTPANAVWLHIRMVGGGGGGSGSGTTFGGAATSGGASTFGTSLLTCGPGGGCTGISGPGGLGGTVTVNSPAISLVALTGQKGQGPNNNSPSNYNFGAAGGASPFGGNGLGSTDFVGAGMDALAYTGSGGGGAGCNATSNNWTGGGGGSGGYIEAIINSPAASYAYAVGGNGSRGAAGANGQLGGFGGYGVIYVIAYFA